MAELTAPMHTVRDAGRPAVRSGGASGWGPADQAFIITLASLAAGAARSSTVVNFQSIAAAAGLGILDVLIYAQIKLAAGTSGAGKAVHVYGYGTTGGTAYPDNVTGADAAVTLNNPTNLRRIGSIQAPTPSTLFKTGPLSLRAITGGVVPSRGGVVIVNDSGIALTGTPADHAVVYQVVFG